MSKPTLVVLAAGMGSRYGGIKQIDPVGPGGEIVLDYSVYDAIQAGFGKVVFVIRRELEEAFREHVGARFAGVIEVTYAFQEMDAYLPDGFEVPADRAKPWGTGHAILVCREQVRDPFCVINADDFYGRESFTLISDFLTDGGGTGMVGYRLANTLSDHGTVSRGVCTVAEGNLQQVVERTDIERDGNAARFKNSDGEWELLTGEEVVSMNFWGFDPEIFAHLESQFTAFIQKRGSELKSEFYIPSVVDRLIREESRQVRVLETSAHWFGVTYPEDKPIVVQRISTLLDDGTYPERLWN